ncbi:MAG: RHS repeat-associated core domain-containing protein [Chloroflexota bacterium]
MTQRVENGLTYTQTFDAENRLISVTVNSQTTQFVYDGDGNLVKKVKPDGSKTIYVGGLYEVDKNAGGTVTKTTVYYPAGGAMRVNGTLYYVLKDHLGSASVVTDSSGNVVGEQRYYPFGETRLTTGTLYTDKLFTGQREMAGLGIYHYGARFYSPKLGRFLSADSIVPNPFNPQDYNRFAYVRNNPVRYVDSSGNIPIDCYGTNYCGSTKSNLLPEPYVPQTGLGGGGGNNCTYTKISKSCSKDVPIKKDEGNADQPSLLDAAIVLNQKADEIVQDDLRGIGTEIGSEAIVMGGGAFVGAVLGFAACKTVVCIAVGVFAGTVAGYYVE